MKRFVISGVPLCETMTGIPRYMYEVLTRLDFLIDNEEDVEIHLCYPKERDFVDFHFKNIRTIAIEKGKKKWMPQIIVPYAKEEQAVICDMADGFCLLKGSISKIDDVRPAVRKFDSFKFRARFRMILLSVKKNAELVITVSESQKKQLQKFLPNKRIEIFPNGWEHLNRFNADNGIFKRFPNIIQGQYYYSVGSMAKHKNFRWIYEVAKRNPDKQFVIAGNEDLKKWGMDSSGLTMKNLEFVGYVSDDENKALYSMCKAFLHPAFYEGFGIPPLEAVSMGKNIAVSDIPEFRETYGDKITYFDPNDYSFDLRSIKDMSESDRQEILNKYSWAATADMWMDLFRNFGTEE